jgi:glycosyltransferase involved in cell wall biosynthesis
MNKKVVLTMIVKNEEHVIERVLVSCLPIIDTYCIVDTGSTDNTKQIIKDFFDSRGITGKLIDFPFTNFEECRNQTIIHGKELGDFGFWIDADEELILNDDFNKTNFDLLLSTNKDIYTLDCNYSGMLYKRTQLYNLKSDFEWYGPVHEALRKKDLSDCSIGSFNMGYVKITPDGNSWKTDLSEKYENHAKILLEYQEQNNWKDPRWTFYLAQSYRDAGQVLLNKDIKDEKGINLIKKSVHYYKQRLTEKPGYLDEKFYSQLMVARLSYFFASNEDVFLELIRCEEYNFSNRCEHLFSIVSYLQREKMFKSADLYCTKALKYIKDGLKSNLFVEQFIYDWAFYDTYGTNLFYINDLENSLKYTKYALKKLNETDITLDTERKRIEDNIKSIETAISSKR